MIRNIIKNQKTGILSGVISSVFVIYFIQPILSYSAQIFIWASESIGGAYSDRLYKQISHLETIDYSFFLFTITLVIPAAFLTGLATSFLIPKDRSKKTIDNDTNNKPTNNIIFKISIASFIFASSIFLLTTVVSHFIQLSTISSFKQHMRIVAPYISQQEEEKIMSEWSLMNSKFDYQSIYQKLNKISSENNISLPENKIYSLLSI